MLQWFKRVLTNYKLPHELLLIMNIILGQFWKRCNRTKAFIKEWVYHTELTNSVSICWNKQPAFVSIGHGEIVSWQIAGGNTAGRELTASCVHPAQLRIRTTRPPGAWGWQTDKALPTHCTFPTFSESRAQLNLLSVCMPGAVVW